MSEFNSYYTARYMLSKGSLFNATLSDRSDGKTFDSAQRILEDYEKDGTIGIYMRRFKTEFTQVMYDGFFEDNLSKPFNERFLSWQFKGSKKGVQVRKSENEDWDWICFFVPLTMSGKLKSTFNGFHQRIHCINFDEYIPLDDRYAPNEMTLLLEFWKTIDRDRNTTQLIILGNRVVEFNPFFDYFNIRLDITGQKVRTYRDGTLSVQIYVNKEHRTKREDTPFKSLIKGTEYDNYDSGGILKALKLKTASRLGADYFCSFKSDIGEGRIWKNGRNFIISTYKRKDGIILVDHIHNIAKREEFVITYGKFSLLFRDLYKTGRLCYEDMESYRAFEPLLRMVYRSA